MKEREEKKKGPNDEIKSKSNPKFLTPPTLNQSSTEFWFTTIHIAREPFNHNRKKCFFAKPYLLLYSLISFSSVIHLIYRNSTVHLSWKLKLFIYLMSPIDEENSHIPAPDTESFIREIEQIFW